MSYYNNKPEKGKEDEVDPVETIGKAVGALAGIGFAAWGAYKLFTGSESSRRKEPDTAPLAYTSNSQGLFGAAGGGWPSISSSSTVGRSVADQWCCPAMGWVKVNTDASLKENNSSVAIGGVIRDHKGIWKVGFSGRIVPGCSIPHAELWAIKVGLETAWDEGFRQIEIETDSEAALRLLNNGNSPNDLVEDCRKLIGKRWVVVEKHCPKKCNKVADIMADLGHGPDFEISNFLYKNDKIEYYYTPPPKVDLHYNRELNLY